TGRSKISGGSRSRRVRSAVATLELQTRGEGSVGDLDLRGRRLRGGETVLQLVPRLRERAGERLVGITDHPAEDLRRRCERSELRGKSRGGTQMLRRSGRQRVADRRRRKERADEVRAAALVLLRAQLAVLVGPDRDVLGAMIGGEVGAAKRES